MSPERFPSAMFEIIEYALTGDIEQARRYTKYLLSQCERTGREGDADWLRQILATDGQTFIPAGAGSPDTWKRKGDSRIGKRASTRDNRGQIVRGKVTAIITYSNGDEQLQIKAGTPRTGITTVSAPTETVEFLEEPLS
jgi:hypothetical protein